MINQNITDSLKHNYMPYSAHVIMNRALPEIDGLKPSQRRILYTMYKMGLMKGGRKKSQGVVGQTMFLHPHGDMAIYETLVRMSKDAEALLIPFVDSKGNFGKQYSRDMKFASARYTEVKLAKVADELFKDIDKNTVDMIDNYDSTLKEPRLLPVTFPTILTNPQSGIANGMASSIAPFNLREIVDFTIAYLRNQKVNVSDYIKAPDFPTGGNVIYNKGALESIFNNGRGSIDIRATYKIQNNSIIFEEIPYTTTFEAVIERITNLVKEGKMKDIVDIDDIYGINSKGIEITVKANTNKEMLVERLFKLTPLQSSFGCNFNIVVNGRPQVLGVKEIIHEWIKFRANTIKRGASFDMQKKIDEKHLLFAFKQVLLDIDKAISIIRETKKNNEVINNLMESFKIDEMQAKYVAEIKLKHLNEEYLLNQIERINELEKEVKRLEKLINNKKVLAQLIIHQLEDVKKNYGQDRNSNIIKMKNIPAITEEEAEVEDYNVRIFITREGYLKKTPLTSLRGNFNIRVKDGDEIINEYDTVNNSEILIFTDKYNVYKYKTYELENHKPSELGEYLPTFLQLKDENILFTTVTDDFKGWLLIGFEDGRVAKIELSAYETKQNRTMLRNAYANKRAIYWKVIHEDVDLLCISSIDKALILNTSAINPKSSRGVQGNIVMRDKDGSVVKSYQHLDTSKYREAEYYRIQGAGVGKYLRKGDFS